MTRVIYSEVRETALDRRKSGQKLSITGVLCILGLSKSGYYDFCKRKLSASHVRKENVMERIMKIHNESHKIYGAPKITKKLRETGNVISERTVGLYMKELGIRAHYVKPCTQTTINSDFSEELKNILDERFDPDEPNAYWCTDITYIYTSEGFVYLCSIMDLYSRKIVAWTLSKTLEAKYVVETVDKAINARGSRPKVIHSDRGSQYTSIGYERITEGMQRSYSKKSYPWDNACIESFHSLIKREWLNRYKISDYRHAHRLVFEYIDAFYNTQRIHSHCKYKTPAEHERAYYERTA